MGATRFGLALVAALLAAPPALAVHGQPYSAFGTAVQGDEVFLAQVDWSGYWTSMFTVTVLRPDGTVVARDAFPGYGPDAGWAASGPNAFVAEVLLYRAWNHLYQFEIAGVQAQSPMYPGPAGMVYVGHYQDYQLQLFVTPLALPA